MIIFKNIYKNFFFIEKKNWVRCLNYFNRLFYNDENCLFLDPLKHKQINLVILAKWLT